MGAAEKQLDQLNREIAHVTALAIETEHAWLSARGDQQRGNLKEAKQDFFKQREGLVAERTALEAQLAGAGVHIPLLALKC